MDLGIRSIESGIMPKRILTRSGGKLLISWWRPGSTSAENAELVAAAADMGVGRECGDPQTCT